jgi:hypothetical protein
LKEQHQVIPTAAQRRRLREDEERDELTRIKVRLSKEFHEQREKERLPSKLRA